MPKTNIIISIIIFSILFSITSAIKTQTRIIEKKINMLEKKSVAIKKDLHETQLDYYYLSSPRYLSKKVKQIAYIEYQPMDSSRIYLSYLDFIKYQKKITILKIDNEKKIQKK